MLTIGAQSGGILARQAPIVPLHIQTILQGIAGIVVQFFELKFFGFDFRVWFEGLGICGLSAILAAGMVEKKQRRGKRLKRRVMVRFEAGKKNYRGVAVDLSEWGLFIQSNTLLKVGTPVVAYVTLGNGPEITLTGNVRSYREDQLQSVGMKKGGIGIELQSPPKEYVDFVKTTSGQ